MNKVTNFVAQVLAFATGDEAKVIALKNERTSNASLKGQIATLQGKQVEAEEMVETRREALQKAKYPTVRIENATEYLNNIKRAQKSLEEAEEAMSEIIDSIDYWTKMLEENGKQTEVAE